MEELRKYLLEKRKGFYIEETATLTLRHHFLSLLFLIVGFFFSSRGEDYAKESEQKLQLIPPNMRSIRKTRKKIIQQIQYF